MAKYYKVTYSKGSHYEEISEDQLKNMVSGMGKNIIDYINKVIDDPSNVHTEKIDYDDLWSVWASNYESDYLKDMTRTRGVKINILKKESGWQEFKLTLDVEYSIEKFELPEYLDDTDRDMW